METEFDNDLADQPTKEKAHFCDGICLYHTSHESPMLNLHRPGGENSYYHHAIIAIITQPPIYRAME